MKRAVAWLIIALAAFSVYDALSAPSPTGGTLVTRISYADTPGGVSVAYLIRSSTRPEVVVTGASASTVTTVLDTAQGWRTTVTATLDRCGGAIAVTAMGAATVTAHQQRCAWLPVVGRE